MPYKNNTETNSKNTGIPQKSRKQNAKLNNTETEKLFGEFFDGADIGDVVQISFDDISGNQPRDENVLTYKPKKFVKTGDKISNDIVKGFMEGEAVYSAVNKAAHNTGPIVTRVSFTYQNVDIYAPRNAEDKGFTSLDKEVHDAVVSLYAAGNKVFSPAMVYRTMAGKSDSSFVPADKLREISASIFKCMSSIITIDASEEAPIYGLETIYSQNMIYAKAVTLKTKGWEVSAFMLIDEPLLFKYAKIKNQIFSVPLRVLDTPPSKTNDIIVLQGYLVRVIESLRRDSGEADNVVLYSELYELLNYQDASKQKLLRVRNNIKSILNYWVSIGYIYNFTETDRKRIKYSIELEVNYVPVITNETAEKDPSVSPVEEKEG